jgi:hypothetical protein
MAKKEEIIKKWEGYINKVTLQKLIEGDKTPTTKYLDYLCKIWVTSREYGVTDSRKPMNSSTLIKYVNEFDRHLPYIQNKDIYSSEYSDYHKLKVVVEAAIEIKIEKEFKREDHIDVIYEDNNILLLRPKTFQGSLKYGSGTRWCTASKYNPSTFNNYTRNGWLFYIIRKKTFDSDWDKMAFYIKNSSHGPVMNEIETYCSKDIRHTSNTLLNSDWGIMDMIHLHNLVRSVAVNEWRARSASKKVKDFVRKLEDLNIDRAVEELVLVKNGLGPEYEDLITRFKQSVENFQQKITLE